MDSTDSSFPNKPMTELLSALSGILSKDTVRSPTAKKAARPTTPTTIPATRNPMKTIKPLTIEEITAINKAFQPRSPTIPQRAASAKKKCNSSGKLDKIVSRTADGQTKNKPVRKVLDLQQPQPKTPKPLVYSNVRMTDNAKPPKFPKPEITPMSTPFKEYFNNLSDDIIMCIDKTSTSKENSEETESVIVPLCDMLNKAAVSNYSKTELDYLLEVKKQTENNLKMVENCMNTLNNVRETQLKSLYHLKKLIEDKSKVLTSVSEKDMTVTETKKT